MDKAIKTKIHAASAWFREMTMGMTLGTAMATLLALGTASTAQTMPPNHMPDPSNPPAATSPSPSMPPGDDITRRDIADMDQFLDSHPEIAQQLRKDPSLIDNQRWVSDHPALHDYLRDHPQIAGAFRSHPEAFMRDENRYERTEGDRDRDRDRISRKDVTEMDRFLDGHPEIAEQLRKDPSLIDNRQWVASHPALQEYLQTHTQVREAFRSDPNLFMKDENRYDRTEGDRDHDRDDRNRGEFTSFGQFLGGHSNMAAELSADPTLATNKEYLASHPELDEYLKAHPAMSQQLAENPQAVLTSSQVQQGSGFTAKPVGPTPRPKSSNPMPNPNQ